MNEAQQARRVALIALVAVLALALVVSIHLYKTYEEHKVIASEINKHFDFFDKRLERLEKKAGEQR